MKPQLRREDVLSLLRAKGVEDKVALVGVRGYYLDSFGKKGENDRNVYDDAIFVVSPRRFEAFQANTDPSVFRKGIATMKPGVHRYYKGKHKGRYWALRLVGERVEVTRDQQQGDFIGVALNIHKGGYRTTGSEGCQTLSPNDWDDFIELVYDEMDFYGQKQIPYLLVEEKKRRVQEALPEIKKPLSVSTAEKPSANPPQTEDANASFANSQPSNPSTETKVVVKDGDVKIETSENKEPPKKVAIEKPERKGFISTIRTEISAIVAGNGGLQAAIDKAQQVQILGLSARFWTILGIIVLVGSVIYLIYRWFDFRQDAKRDEEITKKLIEANSTADNQVYLVDKTAINYLDQKAFEVIRR